VADAITDAEVVEVGTDLEPAAPVSVLFKTEDPLEIMKRTAEVATALKEFVRNQGLVKQISGRDYLVVEAWQMLGMMLGVTPGKVKSRAVEHGWEGLVELHDRNGRVIGSGDAECLDTETMWSKREDYARKSMAQTRAVGKAYRNTFGFIAKAAGFEATPAEEMPQQQQAEGSSGPAFGPPASPELLAVARKAAGELIHAEPESDAVTELLTLTWKDAGNYLPKIALRAICHAANRVKAGASEADVARAEKLATEHQQAVGEKPKQAPGSIAPPALTGGSEERDIEALTNAGCCCPAPLSGDFNMDCPIKGHGIPAVGGDTNAG
jgi:hypothetical protein